MRVVGLPDDLGATDTLLLMTDPYTFPVERLLEDLRQRRPGLKVVGGLASAGRGPGGNRLVLDDVVAAHGAVGVLLDAAARADVGGVAGLPAHRASRSPSPAASATCSTSWVAGPRSSGSWR